MPPAAKAFLPVFPCFEPVLSQARAPSFKHRFKERISRRRNLADFVEASRAWSCGGVGRASVAPLRLGGGGLDRCAGREPSAQVLCVVDAIPAPHGAGPTKLKGAAVVRLDACIAEAQTTRKSPPPWQVASKLRQPTWD